MKEKYYALTLDDYSLPSIASGCKQYFGTLAEITAFIDSLKADERLSQNHKGLIDAFDKFLDGEVDVTHYVAYNNHRLLRPVKLIATYEYEMGNYEWTHDNIYGFPYYMRFKTAKIKHYWFKYENKYLRCLKADITNLQYRGTQGNWTCREGDYWGYPNIIMYKPPHTYSQLAFQEKKFDTIDDFKKDDENFEPGIDIDFKGFCDDIFGDG